MSARSSRFTVTTVSGSFRLTSSLVPSRAFTLIEAPSMAAIVPRMRVVGAVWAMAAAADRHAATARGSRRLSMAIFPLVLVVPVTGARRYGPTMETLHAAQQSRDSDLPQPGLHHLAKGAGN